MNLRGIYLLHLKVLDDVEIEVGKLGFIKFEKGDYVYVGSDQRNIEKRVQRHTLKKKKRKWHVDYLTSRDEVIAVAAYAFVLPKEYECGVAKILLERGFKAFKRFGSSDCPCLSHFFKIDGNLDKLVLEISDQIKTQPPSKIEFI